jgi:hypothetical protein
MIYLKHSILYGLIGGIACLAWFLGVYNFGINPFFSFWANLVIVIVGGAAFFSIYRYAKPLEQFSFGHGLVVGGFTVAAIGVIASTGIYIASEYFIPQAVEMYKNESLKHLIVNKETLIKESNLEVYNAYLKSVPLINALNSTSRYCISNIFIPGLMFSVLSSLPLRKKKADDQ